jgi:hypothetical protein
LNELNSPVAPLSATNLGTFGAAGNGTYLTDYTPIFTRPVSGALAGSANSAVRFLGDNGGIYIPHQPAFNTNGSFTVECWVKTDRLTDFVATPVSSVYLPAGGVARNGWLIYLNTNAPTADNRWQFRLGNSSGYIYSSVLENSPSVVTGRWYHLAGVFNRTTTNASFYVNGALVDSVKATGPYVPNVADLLTIGTRSDLPNNANGAYATFYGSVDEVAFYPSALTTARILTHYQNGTNLSPSTPYSSLVAADGASGYWRLDEPADVPLPVANNLGSLGTSVNGVYQPLSTPGLSGPRPPLFANFESTNAACGFGTNLAVVRVPPLQLNTNTITLTCWLRRTGNQVGNAGIAFVLGGTTFAGLQCDPGGNNELSYNWDGDPLTENFRSFLTLPDNQWAFAALAVRPNRAEFYLHDGTNFLSATNLASHVVLPFDGGLTIGADYPFATYENFGLVNNLGFVGQMDEVAVFNRGLSAGEIYTQYAAGAGGLAPRIFAEPTAPTNTLYVGNSFTLTADVGGTPALSYQWRQNTVEIPGANGATFSRTNAVLGDTGSYDLVVTNSFGEVLSIPVAVAINPVGGLPGITEDPQGRTTYAGGACTFKVGVIGGGLNYQWQHHETNITGANAATYNIPVVAITHAGDYRVIITNAAGAVTSAVATLLVRVPAPGYEASIIADGAESWYRLDETSGTTMFDALGRNDGTYNGSYLLGSGGALNDNTNTSVTFDGFTAHGEVPFSPGLNANVFTIEAWVRTTNTFYEQCAVASYTQPPGMGYLLYQAGTNWWPMWGDGSGNAIYYWDAGLVETSRWNHLVAVYDGSGYLFYVNGEYDSGYFVTFKANTNAPFYIGVDNPAHPSWMDFWEGEIDEVAYYRRVLTDEQIANHYQLAVFGNSTPPTLLFQPQPESVEAGSTLTFTAAAEGSIPLSFQWTRNNSPIAGATNRTLTLTNVDYSDAAQYRLTITNAAGATNSTAVALLVYPPASFCNFTNQLVLHLDFDGDFNDSSGRGHNGTPVGAPFFVSGILSGAIHVSTDPSLGTSNYVTLGALTDLKFGSNTDFTISMWVRFNGNPADLPFYGDSTNSYGATGVTIAPSFQEGGWSYSLVNENGDGVGRISGANSINNGAWHNLVLSCHRSGNVNWYVDGVRQAQQLAVGLGSFDTPYPVNLGQDGTGAYPYAGQLDIDDFCVWHRALTFYDAQAIHRVGWTYGESIDTIGQFNLTLRRNGTSIELIWQTGTLLQADSLGGPWSSVPGANAPFHSLPLAPGPKFYRVQL